MGSTLLFSYTLHLHLYLNFPFYFLFPHILLVYVTHSLLLHREGMVIFLFSPSDPRFPHSQSEPCYPTLLMHVTCSFCILFLYPNMQLKTNFPSFSLHSFVFACKCHLLVVTWHIALTFCSCLVKCIPVQFSE